MERPPADPSKLLDTWMEWERGETTPGRVMSTLKTAGLRDLLESLAEAQREQVAAVAPEASGGSEPDAEVWTPVV